MNSIAKQLVDIKATDPLTVEITLVGPNADLPTIFAMHHFMTVQDGTTDFSKGIGTGAFRPSCSSLGVRSIGVRNENYFKAQKAPLETFEYFAITDENARVNALLSGDVQIAAAIKPHPYASSRACPASSSSGIPSATTRTSTCASTWRRATRPGSSRASS